MTAAGREVGPSAEPKLLRKPGKYELPYLAVSRTKSLCVLVDTRKKEAEEYDDSWLYNRKTHPYCLDWREMIEPRKRIADKYFCICCWHGRIQARGHRWMLSEKPPPAIRILVMRIRCQEESEQKSRFRSGPYPFAFRNIAKLCRYGHGVDARVQLPGVGYAVCCTQAIYVEEGDFQSTVRTRTWA